MILSIFNKLLFHIKIKDTSLINFAKLQNKNN